MSVNALRTHQSAHSKGGPRGGDDRVRALIEDYHEKLEDYLLPRFEKARRLADLTKGLREQHQAGCRLTDPKSKFASFLLIAIGATAPRDQARGKA